MEGCLKKFGNTGLLNSEVQETIGSVGEVYVFVFDGNRSSAYSLIKEEDY